MGNEQVVNWCVTGSWANVDINRYPEEGIYSSCYLRGLNQITSRSTELLTLAVF